MSNQQWLEIKEVLSELDEASFDMLLAQVFESRGQKAQLNNDHESEQVQAGKGIWEEIAEINLKYGSGKGSITNEEIDRILYGAEN